MKKSILKVNNVTKYYGDFKAVDNLSFTVESGEIFGLLGINGAGKSTLLRLLCGVYKADNGSILIDGNEVYENTCYF